MDRRPHLAVHSSSPDDTAALAAAVADVLAAGDVLVLGGELGAGKTTFTKGLGAALGVQDTITSPTFTLAQVYEATHFVVHHLDVYRINQLDEVIDLALPELYESEGIVIIEWGDKIVPALPESYLLVRFAFGESDDQRTLSFTAVGRLWQSRLSALRAALGDPLIGQRDL